MRPLRYAVNVTLDGCCDHRVMIADEDIHRHALETHVVSSTLERVERNAELSKGLDLTLVSRLELGSGAVALRLAPRR